jgi:hypothetical protein
MGDIAAFFFFFWRDRRENIFSKESPLPLFPEKKMVGSY